MKFKEIEPFGEKWDYTVRTILEQVPDGIRWDRVYVYGDYEGFLHFEWDEKYQRDLSPEPRKLAEIDREISNLQKEREDILNGEC